jgi:CubicO group peptidase (beta-lactamase class C family)
VGVAHNGLTILERAYGMADLEHDIPNTPSTIFEGGSVSKQFTSAAIVLLALDGKLSLGDDVRKYVPEVPDHGETITLRHMMTHTSGLRDWGSVASISGWGREERTHHHAHVLDILSRQSALNFEPGHEYSYSNSGYNLLAIVVARVSGMPFAEFSKKRIFEPLGMKDTQWRDDYTRIVKGRSTAYSVDDENRVSIMRPIEYVHGNGGILTTVSDLILWTHALADGRLGGPEFRRMMHQQGRLNDGREIAYASGLRVSELDGVPSVTHTGSTAGYRAFLGRYPEQDLVVAMLCNASNVPTGETGGKVARVVLGDALQPPAEPVAVSVSSEELSKRAGLYRNVRTSLPLRLVVENGRLQIDGRELTELTPISETEFQAGAGGARYVFDPASDGRRSGLRRIADDSDGNGLMHFEPVDAFEPSAAELRAFEGTYRSYDAETTLVVSVVDGALTARRRPETVFQLSPEYEDAFDAPELGFVRFRRNDRGEVIALSLRIPRVYDMRFQRIEGRESQ